MNRYQEALDDNNLRSVWADDHYKTIREALRIMALIEGGEWVVGPAEPTEDMLSFGDGMVGGRLIAKGFYEAMLTRAPKPTGEQDDQ